MESIGTRLKAHTDSGNVMNAGTSARRLTVELLGTVLGSVLVLFALIIIWGARISQGRDLYVSELGARVESTASWFEVALLLIVAGGSLIAFAGRDIRSRLRFVRSWTPALSLWIGCAGFLVASQVPCTQGCPLPAGSSFHWEDLIHTVVAVVAFAAACVAMLQTSFIDGHRALAWFSLGSAIAVAVIAGIGGIFSLLRFQANLGSRFELAATTIALGWLIVLGWMLAAQLARRRTVLVVLGAEGESAEAAMVPRR